MGRKSQNNRCTSVSCWCLGGAEGVGGCSGVSHMLFADCCSVLRGSSGFPGKWETIACPGMMIRSSACLSCCGGVSRSSSTSTVPHLLRSMASSLQWFETFPESGRSRRQYESYTFLRHQIVEKLSNDVLATECRHLYEEDTFKCALIACIQFTLLFITVLLMLEVG